MKEAECVVAQDDRSKETTNARAGEVNNNGKGIETKDLFFKLQNETIASKQVNESVEGIFNATDLVKGGDGGTSTVRSCCVLQIACEMMLGEAICNDIAEEVSVTGGAASCPSKKRYFEDEWASEAEEVGDAMVASLSNVRSGCSVFVVNGCRCDRALEAGRDVTCASITRSMSAQTKMTGGNRMMRNLNWSWNVVEDDAQHSCCELIAQVQMIVKLKQGE